MQRWKAGSAPNQVLDLEQGNSSVVDVFFAAKVFQLRHAQRWTLEEMMDEGGITGK
jgi:hypothetical protein